MTSRRLKSIPDWATRRRLSHIFQYDNDISYQFDAPVITISDSLTPAQETLLDLILADYIYD